jgi:hypothetical protein
MSSRVGLFIALLLATTSALRLPSRPNTVSRRQLGASALAALALPLTSSPAFAGIAKSKEDISPERLKELEKNRGPELGEDQAYRIVCDRNDDECLKKKREKAAGNLKIGAELSMTEEERKAARSAAIQKQAKACRAFCGRKTLGDCDGKDTACLEQVRKEMEAEGQTAGGEGIVPYVGAAAVIVVGAITQAPEKSEAPKGMEIRKQFYEKRKADTEATGGVQRSAFEAAEALKAEKGEAAEEAPAEAEEAPAAEGE